MDIQSIKENVPLRVGVYFCIFFTFQETIPRGCLIRKKNPWSSSRFYYESLQEPTWLKIAHRGVCPHYTQLSNVFWKCVFPHCTKTCEFWSLVRMGKCEETLMLACTSHTWLHLFLTAGLWEGDHNLPSKDQWDHNFSSTDQWDHNLPSIDQWDRNLPSTVQETGLFWG